MAEYIDRAELKARLEDFSKWCRDERKQGVDFVLDCPLPDIPTEDVVPRSEVYEIVKFKDMAYAELKSYFVEAKQEVAKQIFEEIENIISKNTQHDIKAGQLIVSGYNGRQIVRFIKELKKKYIGE